MPFNYGFLRTPCAALFPVRPCGSAWTIGGRLSISSWMGMNDLDVEDVWRYSASSLATYFNWRSGNPAAGEDDDAVCPADPEAARGVTSAVVQADPLSGFLKRYPLSEII